MHHHPTPASSNPPPDLAADLLRHFPREVREALARLREAPDELGPVRVIVHAVVRDHTPDPLARQAALKDETALIDDLRFDSMAVSEMVFFFEDLFAVSISNDEILRVRTVGDLCAFVHQKLLRAAARIG